MRISQRRTRYASYLPTMNRAHMVYTEAQTLDEALSIIKAKTGKHPLTTSTRGRKIRKLGELRAALDKDRLRKKPPVTLATVTLD